MAQYLWTIFAIILLSKTMSESISSSESSSYLNLPVLQPLVRDRKLAAKQYYDLGMKHALNSNYKSALSYLQAACRLDNTSALYWNDLGVTEMRMGDYHKAKKRFLRALEVDKDFTTAEDNMGDIRGYLTQEAFEDGLRQYRMQHKVHAPRVVSMDELLASRYTNDTVLDSPFVVRGAAQSLGWNLTGLSIANLIGKFSQYRVDFYPHNMLHEHVHPYFTSLADGIRQVIHFPEGLYEDIDISQPGTYVQWNLNSKIWDTLSQDAKLSLPRVLTDDHWIRSCIGGELISDFQLKTHWKMLLIGEAGSGMFNHKDSLRTASWQVQVLGKKRWHLCPSSEDKRMYGAGKVDAFKPDYHKYPLFKKVSTCAEFVVEAGDMLFYPHDTWHQTYNYDTPTVSITGTVVTSKNHRLIADELRKECDGRGSIFPADQALCPALQMCYQKWNELYERKKNDSPIDL